MRRVFLLLAITLISSCITNIHCVDYMVVTKVSGTKDTIKYEYWNTFEMDESKMDWMLMNKGIKITDVDYIDFVQGTRTKFNKHYQLK